MRAADCEVWLRNTPDDQDGWYHIDAQMQKGEDGKWYFIPFIASEYRPVRVKEIYDPFHYRTFGISFVFFSRTFVAGNCSVWETDLRIPEW
jgi:hypothetical protein